MKRSLVRLGAAAALLVPGGSAAQDFGMSVIDGTIGTEGLRSATEEGQQFRKRAPRQGLSVTATRYCANKEAAKARLRS